MADNWEDDEGTGMVADTTHQQIAYAPAPAELPEIKLFNKWSCDDVQVSDMSLQVSNWRDG